MPQSTEPIGDVWKVTVEQWRRVGGDSIRADNGLPGGTLESMANATAYAVAHCASDAAAMIEEAFTSNHGPLTRVFSVEYVGPGYSSLLTRVGQQDG